jgi:hypothetical protein
VRLKRRGGKASAMRLLKFNRSKRGYSSSVMRNARAEMCAAGVGELHASRGSIIGRTETFRKDIHYHVWDNVSQSLRYRVLGRLITDLKSPKRVFQVVSMPYCPPRRLESKSPISNATLLSNIEKTRTHLCFFFLANSRALVTGRSDIDDPLQGPSEIPTGTLF